jgi:hypothetical protein
MTNTTLSTRPLPAALMVMACMLLAGCDTGPAGLFTAPGDALLSETAHPERVPDHGEHKLSEFGIMSAGLVTWDLTSGVAATDLAEELVGAGVAISNVTYTGHNRAAGKFSGGDGIIGFEAGIILSTGDIALVVGPNTRSGISAANNTAGDSDLSVLAGRTTFDAAILEFDFVADADSVYFQYVFASDEYNEYVHSAWNDVFAFFVNGVNCATVGDPPVAVSINNVNNGRPVGTNPVNPEFYINNDPFHGGVDPAHLLNTEMDGLTVVLTCRAEVLPNETNRLKLAIADASDRIIDSNVFIKAGSFSTIPPDVIPVEVDIRPTSVNPVSAGLLPVAILGSEVFAVADIDPATITLGDDDGDDTPVAARVNGTLYASFEDVDADGIVDLVLHFRIPALVENGDLTDATEELVLNGATWDGVAIKGSDSVRVVGK